MSPVNKWCISELHARCIVGLHVANTVVKWLVSREVRSCVCSAGCLTCEPIVKYVAVYAVPVV